MNIFENLENLEVSEACFEDILAITEEIINEVSVGLLVDKAKNSLPLRRDKVDTAISLKGKHSNELEGARRDAYRADNEQDNDDANIRHQIAKEKLKNDEGAIKKGLERVNRAEKISKLGELISDKSGTTLKYQANARDFIKKFNRINRKMEEKGQKSHGGDGTFPERKELRKEFQKEISSGGGTVHGMAPKYAKEQRYSHYIDFPNRKIKKKEYE